MQRVAFAERVHCVPRYARIGKLNQESGKQEQDNHNGALLNPELPEKVGSHVSRWEFLKIALLSVAISTLVTAIFFAVFLTYVHGYTEWYKNAPYVWMPEEYRWPLFLLYIVFIIDVVLLYFLCNWYMRYKFAHPEKKWLKYL